VVRRWIGDGYSVETIAIADDAEPADGDHILTFDQARRRAITMAEEAARAAKGQTQRRRTKAAPWTVADAMTAYLDYLDRETKSGRNSRNFANASILPQLGTIRLRDLTTDTLRRWLHELATSARKSHGRVKLLPAPVTDEDKRRRRSSANRIFTVLRCALNHAFAEGHVDSDKEWRRVKPLREADAPRVRWLSVDEMRRLVSASEEPFRSLLMAALHTGCRYGELCRLTVGDFDAASDTVLVRVSKSGKSRYVTLARDASAFFAQLCAGRSPGEVMLTNSRGLAWRSGQQDKPMRAACVRAGIDHANFHCLRHTFASTAVQAGIPLLTVARSLGHSTVQMLEKHYAHLHPEHVRETIQSRMPALGLVDDYANVVALVRR
jgi:integrase